HGVQVAVCADRFHLVGDGGEAKFFAVRRKLNIAGAAAFIGRNIVVRSCGEVARSGAAIGGYDKQVGALAFIPMRPVAIEKMLGDMGLHFVLFFFGVALAVAIIVFAVRIHR